MVLKRSVAFDDDVIKGMIEYRAKEMLKSGKECLFNNTMNNLIRKSLKLDQKTK